MYEMTIYMAICAAIALICASVFVMIFMRRRLGLLVRNPFIVLVLLYRRLLFDGSVAHIIGSDDKLVHMILLAMAGQDKTSFKVKIPDLFLVAEYHRNKYVREAAIKALVENIFEKKQHEKLRRLIRQESRKRIISADSTAYLSKIMSSREAAMT